MASSPLIWRTYLTAWKDTHIVRWRNW